MMINCHMQGQNANEYCNKAIPHYTIYNLI